MLYFSYCSLIHISCLYFHLKYASLPTKLPQPFCQYGSHKSFIHWTESASKEPIDSFGLCPWFCYHWHWHWHSQESPVTFQKYCKEIMQVPWPNLPCCHKTYCLYAAYLKFPFLQGRSTTRAVSLHCTAVSRILFVTTKGWLVLLQH